MIKIANNSMEKKKRGLDKKRKETIKTMILIVTDFNESDLEPNIQKAIVNILIFTDAFQENKTKI